MKLFLVLFAFPLFALAAPLLELPTLQTRSGKSYTAVKILNASDFDIGISHSDGAARILLADLPEDLQKRFNYEPKKALESKEHTAKVRELSAIVDELVEIQRLLEEKEKEVPAPEKPSSVEAEIKRAAALKWPGNYEMQLYTVKNQKAAWSKMQTYAADSRNKSLVERARLKWAGNYEMQVYEFENQRDAARQLGRP